MSVLIRHLAPRNFLSFGPDNGGITDFEIAVQDRTLQVFFTEGDFVIPATRLSNGTLRYLCLLAILCDPSRPPLICIEEPELGLHPDILVDAMTELPESVVVCEKHAGITEMKRLSKTDLAVWLDEYRPGKLWIDGQLGGKRW